MAAATASDYTLITPTLKRLGVFDLFQSVTTIQEVTRDKSFPDIYLLAAERLGVAPEQCVVYEDILLGIQSAKSAGFYTVGVEEPFSLPNREKIKQTADRTLNLLQICYKKCWAMLPSIFILKSYDLVFRSKNAQSAKGCRPLRFVHHAS